MTTTLLPLDEWRRLIGWHPWFFWQLSNRKTPITSRVNGIIRQYDWQKADYISRSEILEAIAQAESELATYLGYSVAPHWRTEEIDLDRPGRGCFDSPLQLAEGKLIQVATQSWTLINTAAPTYSDSDSDGLDDTFTATVADTTTDPADAALFFAVADRLPGTETDIERYKIAPVTITRQDANNLKVVGKKWLLVKPAKYEGMGAVPGYDASMTGGDSSGSFDPDVADNFVGTVAFYKETLTNANKATLVYDLVGTETTYQLDVTVVDKEISLVSLGLSAGQTISCTCACGCSNGWWGWGYSCGFCVAGCATQARRIRITYQAGATLADWQTTVMRLSCAELDRAMPDTSGINRTLARWQRDLAQVGAGTSGGQFESYRIDNAMLGNPLGTRAGHIDAWQRILALRQLRGISF